MDVAAKPPRPSILVDTRDWPVVQTVWDGEQSAADVEIYARTVKAIYARREKFVTISWMLRYKASSEVRKRITDLMHESEAEVKRYSICSALIAPSTGFRFALSTILLVKRMVTPYQVCATFDEALKFCRQEAGKRGVLLPIGLKPLA